MNTLVECNERDCIAAVFSAVAMSREEPRARDAIADLGTWFKAEFFTDPLYAGVYEALMSLASSGAAPTNGAIAKAIVESKYYGKEGLKDIAETLVSVSNVVSIDGFWYHLPYYAKQVHEEWRRLSVASEAGEAAQELIEESTDVDSVIERFSSVHSRYTPPPETRATDNATVFDELIDDLDREGPPHGSVASGLTDLDRALGGGFPPGSLNIFAALTGEGKSSLMGHIAIRQVLHANLPILLFSMEMTNYELMQRWAHWITADDYPERDKYTEAVEELKAAQDRFKIFAGSRTISQIESEAMGYIRQKPETALVVVDYLQLVAPDADMAGGTREQQLGSITRRLKQLAMKTGVPVFAASQFNRQANKEGPALNHLRESGSLEQDANTVIFIKPDDKINGLCREVMLTIAKARNCSKGVVKVVWRPAQSRYESIAPKRYSEFDNYNG